MQYRTINDLINVIRNNLWKIPHNIDLVVGVPRSGMLPASVIASYLNIRMSEIDSFVEGKMFGTGLRGRHIKTTEIRKILIVDDTVNSGKALFDTKDKLIKIEHDYELIYCAPYVSPKGAKLVDIYFEIIEGQRIFEWSLFHHDIISCSCLDIDGVLCRDPEYDDDGLVYREFLQTASPYLTTTVKIGSLITCRLEKYRTEIEQWLRNNRITYDNLIMLDFSNREDRIKWGKYGEFKGLYYKKSKYLLFIESSYCQAVEIARISRKPVVCIETNELYIMKERLRRLNKTQGELIQKYMSL